MSKRKSPAKRPPLGIPLEKHREFAFALRGLHNFSQRHGAPKGMEKLCLALLYELDEHVFNEFKNLPEVDRFHIYYPTDGPRFEDSALEHGLAGLEELIATLRNSGQQCLALEHAAKLAELAATLECRQNRPDD